MVCRGSTVGQSAEADPAGGLKGNVSIKKCGVIAFGAALLGIGVGWLLFSEPSPKKPQGPRFF